MCAGSTTDVGLNILYILFLLNLKNNLSVVIGARCLEVGIWGCFKNVEINMLDIQDEDYKRVTMREAREIADQAKEMCDKVLEILDGR